MNKFFIFIIGSFFFSLLCEAQTPVLIFEKNAFPSASRTADILKMEPVSGLIRGTIYLFPHFSYTSTDSIFIQSLGGFAKRGNTQHVPVNIYFHYANQKAFIKNPYMAEGEAMLKSPKEIWSKTASSDWELDYHTSKYILGMQCFKAKRLYHNQEVVAWFCPDLPFPTGVDILTFGLPGVALEVQGPGEAWAKAVDLFLTTDLETPEMPKFSVENKSKEDRQRVMMQAMQSDSRYTFNRNTPTGEWISISFENGN